MTQPNGIKLPPPSQPKHSKFRLLFEFDPKFIAITPNVNINLHLGGVEFVWLCFGIYIDRIEH